MDLPEIDRRADALAEKMLEASQVGDIPARLEGLAHLAQIKAIRDRRHEWNAQVGWRSRDVAIRERELAAMEVAAASAQRATTPATVITGLCGANDNPSIGLPCVRPSGHSGEHVCDEGLTWDQAEPTKPAADRLHELVSYLVSQPVEEHHKAGEKIEGWKAAKFEAASKAYDDAATKLQEILQEGGI